MNISRVKMAWKALTAKSVLVVWNGPTKAEGTTWVSHSYWTHSTDDIRILIPATEEALKGLNTVKEIKELTQPRPVDG